MTCPLQKVPAKPKKTKEPKEDKPKDEEKKEEVPAENGEAKAEDEVSLRTCGIWWGCPPPFFFSFFNETVVINCTFLFLPGTSIRRDGEEGRRGRITSCLEPVLPVPLFLYNSGEYFYLLFSKGSFFSSLIVETHFLWKLQCILRGNFIPSHICTSVIVCQFLFSKWEGVTPLVHTYTHNIAHGVYKDSWTTCPND